jgi:IS30 family transposase
MDFITDLATIRAKNSILVVVDRLTKMAHFTPCSKSITAEETTQLIMDGIVRLHGLPEEIVSDRGPQFASKFWHRLFELLGIDIRLFSAFHHPETDGQTERTNQTLEQYFRCTVNYQQDDWLDLLS